MYDTMVVEVGDSAESGSDQIGGVRFVVGALAADAIKELAAESEVRDEVDCKKEEPVRMIEVHGFEATAASQERMAYGCS